MDNFCLTPTFNESIPMFKKEEKRNLYAYSDETEFKYSNTDTNSIIGAGILVSDKPIADIVIKEALRNLNNDVDKTSADLVTLKRSYFHASEDSKNAHSHLCASINKHVSGYFRFSYFDKQLAKSEDKDRTNENINRLILKLAALDFFHDKIDKVHLTTENRYRFGVIDSKNWLSDFFYMMDGLAYSQPTYKTNYPDIKLCCSSKNNPGLQVVDFILWALNRSRRTPANNIWKERLNLKLYASFSEDEGPQSGGKYYINNNPKFEKEDTYPYEFDIFPNTEQEFFESYLIIENTVRQLCKIDLPDSLEHLNRIILSVKDIFEYNKELTMKTLPLIASIYIRCFDTLPIYKDIDKADEKSWRQILSAKKIAGLILRQDLATGIKSVSEILEWRNEVMT